MNENQKTFQDYMTKFKALQGEIMELSQALENKKAQYRAEMKAAFGLADGDQTSVLDIIDTIRKVQGMA